MPGAKGDQMLTQYECTIAEKAANDWPEGANGNLWFWDGNMDVDNNLRRLRDQGPEHG